MPFESFTSLPEKSDADSALERITSGEDVLQAEIAMREEGGEEKEGNPRGKKVLKMLALLSVIAPAIAAFDSGGSHAAEYPISGGTSVGAEARTPTIASDTPGRGAAPEVSGGMRVAPQSVEETATKYRAGQVEQKLKLNLTNPTDPENQKIIDSINNLLNQLK